MTLVVIVELYNTHVATKNKIRKVLNYGNEKN